MLSKSQVLYKNRYRGNRIVLQYFQSILCSESESQLLYCFIAVILVLVFSPFCPNTVYALCPVFCVDFVFPCSISRKAAHLSTLIVEKPAHLGSIEQGPRAVGVSVADLWQALFSVHFSSIYWWKGCPPVLNICRKSTNLPQSRSVTNVILWWLTFVQW
jgi:hypothetical protein